MSFNSQMSFQTYYDLNQNKIDSFCQDRQFWIAEMEERLKTLQMRIDVKIYDLIDIQSQANYLKTVLHGYQKTPQQSYYPVPRQSRPRTRRLLQKKLVCPIITVTSESGQVRYYQDKESSIVVSKDPENNASVEKEKESDELEVEKSS